MEEQADVGMGVGASGSWGGKVETDYCKRGEMLYRVIPHDSVGVARLE